MARRRRRLNPNPGTMAVPTPFAETSRHGPCQECRLKDRRIRVSLSIEEAQEAATALEDSELGALFQAHVTIASHPDPYGEY